MRRKQKGEISGSNFPKIEYEIKLGDGKFNFQQVCNKANIPPSKRQLRKFSRGEGIAYQKYQEMMQKQSLLDAQ